MGSSVISNEPSGVRTCIPGEAGVWVLGLYGNSVLCTQFCCVPKTALKNKVYLKTKMNGVG